jgi:hypothetical protein
VGEYANNLGQKSAIFGQILASALCLGVPSAMKSEKLMKIFVQNVEMN